MVDSLITDPAIGLMPLDWSNKDALYIVEYMCKGGANSSVEAEVSIEVLWKDL